MPHKPVDPTMKPILVYVDGEVRRKLKIKAARQGTTCTDLVRKALAREVAYVGGGGGK